MDATSHRLLAAGAIAGGLLRIVNAFTMGALSAQMLQMSYALTDLLMLIDKYGADAVRFGIMIASPAGNDLLFDEAALEQGRNFNNKLWNALKLLKGWEGRLQRAVDVGIAAARESGACADAGNLGRWAGRRRPDPPRPSRGRSGECPCR